MSYPDDRDRVRVDKGESAPGELPYRGYDEGQYLDPYTGQPLNSGPAQHGSYGQQPYAGQPYAVQPYAVQPYAVPGYQPYPATPGTNGMAIGALVASTAGSVLCGVGGIVGAILGHIALGQIKRSGEQGRGMALAGVIIGWSITGLVVLYFAIFIIIGVVASSG